MNMLVSQDFRRKGIGGRFLEVILADADSRSRAMWLQVLVGNAPAEQLYRGQVFALAYDYGYYRPRADGAADRSSG